MKSKAFRMLTLLITVVVLFTLAACSPGNEGPAASQDNQPKEQQNNNSEKKITLSFIHFFHEANTEGNAIAFNKVMEKFKSDNPNIIFEEEPMSHDNYETKIKTLAAGNELPDLFIFKGSMTEMMINNKLMNPVDDIVSSDPEWESSFLQGAFDDFVIDGARYGIPFQMLNTHLIYYNKEIFNECGITSFPTDWAGFEDAIQKIKANNITPISLGNKGNWVAESCILSTLGDRFTGVDWFQSIKEGTGAKFTDPEFINALAALQGLVNIDAFNSDLNSIDNMQQKSPYYNGEAAMFMEGNWAISSVINDAPEDILENTELAILPPVEGGKGEPMENSAGAAWAYNVNPGLTGEKLDAAVKVLKAVTDSSYATVAIESNAFPATVSKEVDKSALPSLVSKYLDLSEKIKPVPIYDAQLSPSLIQIMNTGLQELLINGITPEELAAKIQEEYER